MRGVFSIIFIVALAVLVACAPKTRSADGVESRPVTDISQTEVASVPETRQHNPVVGQVIGGVLAGIVIFAGALVLALASASDERLKTDIVRIGTSPDGMPIYEFRYLGVGTVWQGVMAQDVLRRQPSAVKIGRNGYLYVHYRSLGLRMRRVGRREPSPEEASIPNFRRWSL